MPNDPIATDTKDLAVTEYDAAGEKTTAANTPPLAKETPEVGLSQKGEGEDAIVKRETDV